MLAVNQAAVQDYGYSEDEFLAMTIRDIRPTEDVPLLEERVRYELTRYGDSFVRWAVSGANTADTLDQRFKHANPRLGVQLVAGSGDV